MLQPQSRWEIKEVNDEEVNQLAEQSGIHRLVAQLCWQRGIRTAQEVKEFLEIETTFLHDPFLLKGMAEACERVKRAIQNDESILIFGDYDCDGVSATTLMTFLMTQLNARFTTYIPDRFSEGYGLNEATLERAGSEGVNVIITVDTGISAHKEALLARQLGIDLIVTDHHEPPEQLPEAYAIINPKLADCPYPFPFLAGVGVALKLAQALLDEVPEEWFGIAALGTIADLVPLHGENRLIAHRGLKALTHSQNVGIRALIKESGLEGIHLEAYHIGFVLGPRINAGGRLERADIGVDLLTTLNPVEAQQLAKHLNDLNKFRQELVSHSIIEAEQQAEAAIEAGMDKVLVLGGEDWNEGIIGIVASKIVEKYYRPTIVLSLNREQGIAKGSARSIVGFDLYDNLSVCQEFFISFGGHEMAAGLSLEIAHIDRFREKINTLAAERLTPEDYIPKRYIDLQCKLEDINLSLLEQLGRLAPYGEGNPEPLVCIKDVTIATMNKVGKQGDHLKWTFRQHEYELDGIGFHWGSSIDMISPHATLDIVGELSINEWNGIRKPQIMLKDLAIAHIQVFDFRGIRNPLQRLLDFPNQHETAIVYFRTENAKQLEEAVKAKQLTLIPVSPTGTSEKLVTAEQLMHIKQVIMYDLPQSNKGINIFRLFKGIERIWCLFGRELNEPRLDRLPSRDEFRWVYAYFHTKRRATLDQSFIKLAQQQGILIEALYFIIDVFVELNFLRCEEHVYEIIPNPEKRSYTDASLYKEAAERLDVETEWVFSPIQHIAKWLKEVHNEEELKEELCI